MLSSIFGIDLCIGSEADRPITQRQMMFAPFYLMDAFAGARACSAVVIKEIIPVNSVFGKIVFLQ